MTSDRVGQGRPSLAVSLIIFVLAGGVMAYLRLYLFSDRVISLTYALPLLICLWHRDRVLLWGMSLLFVAMSAYKTFVLMPARAPDDAGTILQWAMQLANIAVVGSVVHLVIKLSDRLELRNAELAQANQVLAIRAEEISRQNEELHAQSEELSRQKEEIQLQSEELTRQNEELQQQSEEVQAQSEELQGINAELNHREAMLRMLLEGLRLTGGDRSLLTGVCEALLNLFEGTASGAAVLEKAGKELVVRAQSGLGELQSDRWPLDRSFASLVMSQGRTGFIEDLAKRDDLIVPRGSDQVFRSVLACPFRLSERFAGTVEIYSEIPRQWTTEQFRIIEWVAAQCSLVLQVRRLQDELERSNQKLETLVQERTSKLQELVGELEHFSYSITHDMRAPLRAMQGFAEMLSQDEGAALDGERAEYLRRIRNAASRMDRLITDSLSYSKAVRQELRLTPVDPSKLLKDIVESYPHFQPPRAEVQMQPDLPAVLANEAGLAQCFSNLLNNAVKFVEPNRTPKVRIWADRPAKGVVRLWFEDNGIGIPAEMQPRIFGMFQRLNNAYDGTGIGLALVRKVTERMGGKVGVQSTVGQGSSFFLELKSADLPSEADAVKSGALGR